MTDTLKTLNDIFPACICPGYELDEDCPAEFVKAWSNQINEELKVEAVKWYKKYAEQKQITSETLYFIWDFFNLTEEDLREELCFCDEIETDNEIPECAYCRAIRCKAGARLMGEKA